MIEIHDKAKEHSTAVLTSVATGLGGTAAMGLLGAVVAPFIAAPVFATVTVGAVAGLVVSQFLKKLDK